MAGFIEDDGYNLRSPETNSHMVITSVGDILIWIVSSCDSVHYTA